ncbi:MAG TPA: class II fructose-bisphosphatase [Candidatus Dormibacteraeota bacterium]
MAQAEDPIDLEEMDADPGTPIDRNLALELVRVTEGAAMSAARFMGRDDKIAADRAAVESMRRSLSHVDMTGVVKIGEGEKDRAPMLYIGETIGNGSPPLVDVAVDPIDGTRLVARGLPGGIATVALSERDTLLQTHCAYMEKLVVGPRARGVIDLRVSHSENLHRIAEAEARPVHDLTVVVLDRPRHEELLREIRATGARVKLITDGDVAAGIMAALPERTGLDLLLGVGGATEAVLTAAAVRCIQGDMQCRLWPRDDDERRLIHDEGYSEDQIFRATDLCGGNNIFFAATGITDGEMLGGVRFAGETVETHSVVMRSYTGTVRWIDAVHNLPKLKLRKEMSLPDA